MKKRIDYLEELEKAGKLIAAQARSLQRFKVPEERAKELWHKATELLGDMFKVEAEVDDRPVDAETLRKEYF